MSGGQHDELQVVWKMDGRRSGYAWCPRQRMLDASHETWMCKSLRGFDLQTVIWRSGVGPGTLSYNKLIYTHILTQDWEVQKFLFPGKLGQD